MIQFETISVIRIGAESTVFCHTVSISIIRFQVEPMINIPWLSIYFLASTLHFVYTELLSYRQLKHLTTSKLCKELEGVITDEDYDKSVSYNNDRLVFGSLINVLSFIFMFYTFYFGLHPFLWDKSVVYSDNMFKSYSSEYTKTLIFYILQFILAYLWGVPFEFYNDFVIEERHGFNKKTLWIFVKDELIKIVLLFIYFPPILGITIWVVRKGGDYFFIMLWIAYATISIFLLTIYPVAIAPLFNKFVELQNTELREKINILAAKIHYPLKKIYQMDASKRSKHGNAYMYGFGSNKRIVLFDTLLETSHEQILAIIGHEFGHWVYNHTIIQIIINFVHMFFLMFLFQKAFSCEQLYESFGFQPHQHSVAIGFFVFMNVYKPISFFIEIICNIFSRHLEFEADKYSAKELKMKNDLKEALIELYKKNLVAYNVDPWYEWYHYSHPHLVKRLQAIEAIKID